MSVRDWLFGGAPVEPPLTAAQVALAIKAGQDSADLEMTRLALRRLLLLTEMARRALADNNAEMRAAFLARVEEVQFAADFALRDVR